MAENCKLQILSFFLITDYIWNIFIEKNPTFTQF